MGIATVYLAQGLKDGTITLGEGNTFEVPGSGTLTFGPNNVVITGAPDTFNAENINDFDF